LLRRRICLGRRLGFLSVEEIGRLKNKNLALADKFSFEDYFSYFCERLILKVRKLSLDRVVYFSPSVALKNEILELRDLAGLEGISWGEVLMSYLVPVKFGEYLSFDEENSGLIERDFLVDEIQLVREFLNLFYVRQHQSRLTVKVQKQLLANLNEKFH